MLPLLKITHSPIHSYDKASLRIHAHALSSSGLDDYSQPDSIHMMSGMV